MNRLETPVMPALQPLSEPTQQSIHFIRLDQIRPNEQHYPEHALLLADTILREQYWRVPIALERHSLAVMDGHHRLEAARRLKLMLVPCLLLDYSQVEVSPTRQGYVVTPQEILRRAASGELYPPKTTRHNFPLPPPACNISLSLLTPASARSHAPLYRSSIVERGERLQP
jgi:hypothetical protein